METKIYKPRSWNLSGLNGISDKTLEMHFKLYEGYVTNTNTLHEKIAAILSDGNVDQEEMPAYSELTRRLGFEYNGMILHEYYFDNMTAGGNPMPTSGKLVDAINASFGSVETYLTDFKAVATMRGTPTSGATAMTTPQMSSALTPISRARRTCAATDSSGAAIATITPSRASSIVRSSRPERRSSSSRMFFNAATAPASWLIKPCNADGATIGVGSLIPSTPSEVHAC